MVLEKSQASVRALVNSVQTRGVIGVTDRLSREERSNLMGRVRQSGTAAELAVRRLAHRLGFRFRLGRRDLPGSPDIVFLRHQAVVFVHGCFWHQHKGCRRATTPHANRDFWVSKFEANVRRDAVALARLHELGWRTMVVWECEISNASSLEERLSSFLSGGSGTCGRGDGIGSRSADPV